MISPPDTGMSSVLKTATRWGVRGCGTDGRKIRGGGASPLGRGNAVCGVSTKSRARPFILLFLIVPVSPAVVADLRSDTVTVPDAAMRRAMADAEVGDDVYGEDPTASRLEARVAEIAGKEAALFVPSGVMSNQLALKVHTSAGDEALVERGAHVLNYESGAAGLLSGVTLLALDDPRGRGHLTADVLASGLRSGTYYWEARQRVAWFENTANRAGGTVQPPGETAAPPPPPAPPDSPCTSTARASGTPPSPSASTLPISPRRSTPSACACRRDSAHRSGVC